MRRLKLPECSFFAVRNFTKEGMMGPICAIQGAILDFMHSNIELQFLLEKYKNELTLGDYEDMCFQLRTYHSNQPDDFKQIIEARLNLMLEVIKGANSSRGLRHC